MRRVLAIGCSIFLSVSALFLIFGLIHNASAEVGGADIEQAPFLVEADTPVVLRAGDVALVEQSPQVEPDVPGREIQDSPYAGNWQTVRQTASELDERVVRDIQLEERTAPWMYSQMRGEATQPVRKVPLGVAPSRVKQAGVNPKDAVRVNEPSQETFPYMEAIPAPSEASTQIPSGAAPDFVTVVEPLHRNTNSGLSSIFVFTNTSGVSADYTLNFYWPNGVIVGTENRFGIPPGGTVVYDMVTDPVFGENPFFGEVHISSDQTSIGKITTPDYGSVLGVIYEDNGTTPLPANHVEINNYYNHEHYGDTYVMSDGRYFLGGLPDEDYILRVFAPYPWADQWYDGWSDWRDADMLTISNAVSETVDFVLHPGGWITGTIYKEGTSETLADINVDIGQGWFGTCTDENGVYTVEGVPYGEHVVQAGFGHNWCLGHQSEYVGEYYSNTPQYDQATLVVVTSTLDIAADIDFTLEVGGMITGTVYNASGTAPLENVNVDIDDGGYGTCTDAQGRYAISGLPGGEYRVRAGGDHNWCIGEQSVYLREFYQETDDWNAAALMTISPTQLLFTGVDFTLEEGGVITGTVFADDGTTRLENVNVDIDDGGYGTCTDDQGRYTIQGLPNGEYKVRAGGDYNWCTDTQSEYIQEYYDGTYDWNAAIPLTINPGQKLVTGIDFTMEVGGVITGQVKAASGGAPLEGVHVAASEYEDEWYWAHAWTNASGMYTITGLVEADYRVRVDDSNEMPPGYAFQYYPYQDWHHLAEPVHAAPGTPVPNIDFALEVGGVITGRVTTNGGADPFEGAWVSLNEHDNWWHFEGENSDPDGYYSITRVPAGTYAVGVSPSYPWAHMWFDGQFNDWEADPVTVGWGEVVQNIDFDMQPGGIITGYVYADDGITPLADITVDLGSHGACTDENGYYEVTGLPYGEHIIWAGGDWNWCLDQESRYLREYYQETSNMGAATPILIDSGFDIVGDINFTLSEGGYIAGTVMDENHNPLQNLQVVAVIPRPDWCNGCWGWYQDSWTDVDGSYTVGPLPTGEFSIYVETSDTDYLLVSEFYSNSYNVNGAENISVTAGFTVTGINVSLDPGIWLTGTVTVPEGYDPGGIQIDAWTSDGPFWSDRRTYPDGTYIVPVPPFYDNYWGLGVHPRGTDLGSQWAHQFELSKNTHWDFELGPGSTITGYVTSEGVPVPDIWVVAESKYMGHGEQTDGNGYYEITNLPPGNYGVYTEHSPYFMYAYYGGHDWQWDIDFPVGEGETIGNINIDVSPLGQLEGHVYEGDEVTPIEGVRVIAMNDLGFWETWTQPDGAFYMDLPAGDHKVYLDTNEAPSYAPKFYPDASWWVDAITVTVPTVDSGPAYISTTLEAYGTLSGQITDIGDSSPVPGIHVAAQNVDPADGRETASWTCTDENGDYTLEMIIPGKVLVTALGTCGNYNYELVTDTLAILTGGNQNLDIQMTAGSVPERPLTIRTEESFDYSPFSSRGINYLNVADQILPALFEPLVQLNDQGDWFSELLVQVPSLDNGGAAIIGDQLVVTYTLKSNLLWSDGGLLTSEDIRFTWEMLTKIHPNSEPYLFEVGLLSKIAQVGTPDDQTAVVTYKPGVSPPSYQGAFTYLLPQHTLDGEHPMDIQYVSEYAHDPVGNGPYVVADWVPGSHLDLVANPLFREPGSGFPVMDEVRFLFTDDPFWSLTSDNVDISVLGNSGGQYVADAALYGLDVYTSASQCFNAIVPDLELPFFQDVDVRRALYHALDRDATTESFTPESPIPHQWLPPDNIMYTEVVTTYDYNLAMANSMLDAAGWTDRDIDDVRMKDGVRFEFDYYFPTNNWRGEIGAIFQADLETIGVDVNLVDYPWNTDVWQEGFIQQARRGNFDTYSMGWCFDNRYDPMGSVFLHSDSIATAYNSYEGRSYHFWWDETNDALLEAARTELDRATLIDLYAQQTARYAEYVPSWTERHYATYDFAVPTLVNFKPMDFTPSTWNIAEWELPPNPYDLSVRKALALESPSPQPGEVITYEIKVRNLGYFEMTNATLMDILPVSVTYVSAGPTPAAVIDNVLYWDMGTVPGNSLYPVVKVVVQIPDGYTHGTVLTNTVQVWADQPDTHPENDAFVHTVTILEDVDLDVGKYGIGQPAIGEQFNYYINYANWGGAPAQGVVLTDTLPPEVTYQGANPPPTSIDSNLLTWDLADLAGNQWGGQIEITATIDASGTVINLAEIVSPETEDDYTNNQDDHVELVDDILAPLIVKPTRGTTDETPTVVGFAPAGSVVDLWDLVTIEPTWLASTTVSASGIFTMNLSLAASAPGGAPEEIDRTYVLAATATKDGLTSGYSNAPNINVRSNLPLDPDNVQIKAGDVDISNGSVEALRNILGFRVLDIQAVIPCTSEPTGVQLWVTENTFLQYSVPPVSLTEDPAGKWNTEFRLWLAEPHSTYDIWLQWDCNNTPEQEQVLLVSLVIDPDGFLFDQSMVDAGSAMENALILDGVVTAYVKMAGEWVVWSAESYGQTNPQVTDGTTDDGVVVPGYFSFLTPPGQFFLKATAPGYQPYQSEILTVIDTPIRNDIGLVPVVGGTGFNRRPVDLSKSGKYVDKEEAWLGDTLVYDIALVNTGDEETELIQIVDPIPENTAYVAESLSWDGGNAWYDGDQKEIVWEGVVPGGESVNIHFEVEVVNTPGTPFDVVNTVEVNGDDQDLRTLPELQVVTAIQNQAGVALSGADPQNADPGALVVFEHILDNTGNYTDTYEFSASSSQGWTVDLADPVTLGPGISATVGVTVHVSVDALADVVESTTVTATSQTAESFFDVATDQTTVNQVLGLSLGGADPQSGYPGETMTYTHHLKNTGNVSDTYNLEAFSALGWVVVPVPLQVTLEPGEAVSVSLIVEIPLGVEPDTVEHSSLTVTSQTNEVFTEIREDVTTVVEPPRELFLPLIVR